MATIRKRAWGKGKEAFILTYTDHGGKRRQETFNAKANATARKLEIENELDIGVHTARTATKTFAEALEGYLAKQHDVMAGSSMAYYRSAAKNHIMPTFGRKKLTDITSLQINDHLDAMAKDGYERIHEAVATIIRKSLEYAVKRKWLKRSPLTDEPIELPPIKRNRRAIPTREEIKALLVAAGTKHPNDRFYIPPQRLAIVMLGLFCGLRRGEITGLQWEDVDFENDVLHVRHSFSWETGLKGTKSGKPRSLALPPPVRWALEQWAAMSSGPRAGYVFKTASGEPIYSMIRAYMKRSMEMAGITEHYSMHTLRHVAVTLMHERGMDVLEIGKIVGHSSPSITMNIYAHLFDDAHKGRKLLSDISADMTEHLNLELTAREVPSLPAPAAPGNSQFIKPNPWVDEGVSERTWYLDRQREREAKEIQGLPVVLDAAKTRHK